MSRERPRVDAYIQGMVAGDRAWLARAITLVESQRLDDRAMAAALLAALPSPTQSVTRVGISGVPGAGKSTVIEALGMRLVAEGHRVAVLAVDPSSTMRGGSILGDKTRMTQLSVTDHAYVRPTPSRGYLGGIGRRTRETISLIEAAGFDIVLIETVGVGQSEVAVADVVDTVVLLALAGGGDGLQGIKRGILEIADVVAFNKADGAGRQAARDAAHELRRALGWLRGHSSTGVPPVILVSAEQGEGIDVLWEKVQEHRSTLGCEGIAARRTAQFSRAFREILGETVVDRLCADPRVLEAWPAIEAEVVAGRCPVSVGVDRLLALWRV